MADAINQSDREKRMEQVYAEATSTLTELSKSRHKASRLYFRLVQGFLIWFSIFTVLLPFSASVIRDLYVREAEYEVKPMDLISMVVVAVSAFQCVNLGIATQEVQASSLRAKRRFDALSKSLYR